MTTAPTVIATPTKTNAIRAINSVTPTKIAVLTSHARQPVMTVVCPFL